MLALVISGIVIGCVYALIAAGYAIVYRLPASSTSPRARSSCSAA